MKKSFYSKVNKESVQEYAAYFIDKFHKEKPVYTLYSQVENMISAGSVQIGKAVFFGYKYEFVPTDKRYTIQQLENIIGLVKQINEYYKL